MRSIIWASCFLAPPNAVYDAFSEIARLLLEQEVQLVVFGSAEFEGSAEFQYIKVPFTMFETGQIVAASGQHFDADAPEMTEELVLIDQVWGISANPVEVRAAVRHATSFWEASFKAMQPCAILAWGSTAPLSRMFLQLARRFQRPALVLERGMLEDTLLCSIVGQGSLSNFNTTLALVNPLITDPEIVRTWNSLTLYYKSVALRHYPEINQPISEMAELIMGRSPYPRVLYMGSFDSGSGTSFDSVRLGDMQGTWVKTSEDAAGEVAAALKRICSGGSLWIKVHPGSPFAIAESDELSISYFNSTDIYSLVEACDVCVTLNSTTQFLSLLHGKPLITLGNSQLMGRDIAYEARSTSELISAMSAALAKEELETRLSRGRAVLAASYLSDHIGLTQEVPTRHKIVDFVKMLARFKHYNIPGAGDSQILITTLRAFFKLGRLDRKEQRPGAARSNIASEKSLSHSLIDSSSFRMLYMADYYNNLIEISRLRKLVACAQARLKKNSTG